jgi:hypothetical protein
VVVGLAVGITSLYALLSREDAPATQEIRIEEPRFRAGIDRADFSLGGITGGYSRAQLEAGPRQPFKV